MEDAQAVALIAIADAMKQGYLSDHARRVKPVPELGFFGPWR
jgi:hypothetical protein